MGDTRPQQDFFVRHAQFGKRIKKTDSNLAVQRSRVLLDVIRRTNLEDIFPSRHLNTGRLIHSFFNKGILKKKRRNILLTLLNP